MGLFVQAKEVVDAQFYGVQVADGTAPVAFSAGFVTGGYMLFRADVCNVDSIDHNVIIGFLQSGLFLPIGFAFLAAATPAFPTWQNIIAGLAAPQNSGIPVNSSNLGIAVQVAEAVTTNGAVRAAIYLAH